MIRTTIAITIILTLNSAAAAKRFIDTTANRQLCMRDVTRFCLADVERSPTAIIRCLLSNYDKLSSECAVAFR